MDLHVTEAAPRLCTSPLHQADFAQTGLGFLAGFCTSDSRPGHKSEVKNNPHYQTLSQISAPAGFYCQGGKGQVGSPSPPELVYPSLTPFLDG